MTPLTPHARVCIGDRTWTVGAVGTTGGERYYWLVSRGEIAMLPWFVVGAGEDNAALGAEPRDPHWQGRGPSGSGTAPRADDGDKPRG